MRVSVSNSIVMQFGISYKEEAPNKTTSILPLSSVTPTMHFEANCSLMMTINCVDKYECWLSMFYEELTQKTKGPFYQA